MNYKVLYRKYRPDNFDLISGQNHVVTILKNSIRENKIAHAYLFSGPRGTGKTSTARIFAKSVNCLNNDDGSSCNECVNCKSFYSHPDIIEIDAASNNGVEDIRELINNVKIMPTSFKYKVYIIDEVHMLSQSAFNALLLTLEEPPEHVIFILATTNIENVPITILSRCQKFEFKKISDNNIYEKLLEICNLENIKYEDDGLKEIASLSEGGMRDALSVLDQLSKENELITSKLVTDSVGGITDRSVQDLIDSLNNNDIKKIDEFFEKLKNSNFNSKLVIKKIVSNLCKFSIKILNNDEEYSITFDDCKKIIMELNELINKININIDTYELLKIIFLGYASKNNNKPHVIKQEIPKIEKNEPILENKTIVEMPKVSQKNDLIDIRINNCFVTADKKYLIETKPKWDEFVRTVDNPIVKGLLSDTEVVMASDKYLILKCLISHVEDEINAKLESIEDLFNKQTKNSFKMVFISEQKWQEEKEKYIVNLKNKYKYTFIEETSSDENTSDINEISDVFDINKIEVE